MKNDSSSSTVSEINIPAVDKNGIKIDDEVSLKNHQPPSTLLLESGLSSLNELNVQLKPPELNSSIIKF